MSLHNSVAHLTRQCLCLGPLNQLSRAQSRALPPSTTTWLFKFLWFLTLQCSCAHLFEEELSLHIRGHPELGRLDIGQGLFLRRELKSHASKPLDLSNSCYVVLKAEGFETPLLCLRASDYRSVVGQFQPGTLSHGFPSQSEAKVYCAAAGVNFPSSVYQWRPQR